MNLNSQQIDKPLSIKVQLKDEPVRLMTLHAFEEHFKFKYRHFLTFTSDESFQNVVRNCPYWFKWQWLFGRDDELEASLKKQVAGGQIAKVYVKWIDPVFEYGLFADTNLAKNAFIGEYTGVVKRVFRKNPDINGYCFHYPTRFFSFHYYVIDALSDGNLMRFVNHSDDPNVLPLWLYSKGLNHLVFIAKRDIQKGEELTVNYGKDYWIKRKKHET